MAETTTKTRPADYFTVDVWAEDIGSRRFIAKDSREALDILVNFDRAFEGSKHRADIKHVRSFRRS